MKPSLVVLATVTTAGSLHAQQLPGMQELRAALAARDSARAVAYADSLTARYPEYPNVLFNRVRAMMLANRHDEAERSLRMLLKWDPRYVRRALEDSLIAPISSRLGDVDVPALAARADSAVLDATVHATIEERDIIAEGTTYDPSTKSVLVGSLNKYKVLAISPDGSVTDRVSAGSSGLRSVVGIHVDAARGILWAASNRRYDTPADSTPSALYAFDARTGGFRRRIESPVKGPNFFNDITTGLDGTVYMTDTQGGEVWTLRPGASTLERVMPAGDVAAPNGITISGDGKHLFVADFDRVIVVDLVRGESWKLAVPDSINLSGIDGLAFRNDELIAHHPLAFWRIARYRLDSAHRNVTGRTLIVRSSADGRTSTTGEVVDGDYVFIGNSQIDRMNAGTIDAAKMEPVRIYRARL